MSVLFCTSWGHIKCSHLNMLLPGPLFALWIRKTKEYKALKNAHRLCSCSLSMTSYRWLLTRCVVSGCAVEGDLPAAPACTLTPARRSWPPTGPSPPTCWAQTPPAPVCSPAARHGWCSRCRTLQGTDHTVLTHTQQESLQYSHGFFIKLHKHSGSFTCTYIFFSFL